MENTSSLWRPHPAPKIPFLNEHIHTPRGVNMLAAGGNTIPSSNFRFYRPLANYPLRIPNSPLDLELPHFLGQPLDTILILPRQVVYLMYRAVNLLNACRHLIHRVFYNRRELV